MYHNKKTLLWFYSRVLFGKWCQSRLNKQRRLSGDLNRVLHTQGFYVYNYNKRVQIIMCICLHRIIIDKLTLLWFGASVQNHLFDYMIDRLQKQMAQLWESVFKINSILILSNCNSTIGKTHNNTAAYLVQGKTLHILTLLCSLASRL